ncbi:MAG: hypothetical protein DCC71_15400 [Proteobacteria bacterium]|nr:MAG: hypothetical protein DCC71_15400 [Pseudomonadota bacterium]
MTASRTRDDEIEAAGRAFLAELAAQATRALHVSANLATCISLLEAAVEHRDANRARHANQVQADANAVAGYARTILAGILDPPRGVSRPTASRSLDVVELFALARTIAVVPAVAAPAAFVELADLARRVAALFPAESPR